MRQEISITAGETSKKLENFLKKRFPIGYVRKLFRKNGVRLNGRRPTPDDLIGPGDCVQLYIPFEKTPKSGRGAPQDGLDILFEDKDILVVNKSAGLAVHEGKDVLKRHSLLGMLEARYRPRGVAPRLVHRLDRDTSGVLIATKNAATRERFERLFASGEVEKEYLCLLVGRLQQNEGTIDFPVPGRKGKAVCALTHFRVARRFSETTLVRANIRTGRMHQIRLHFARRGYPVVMDDQHGDFALNKRFRKAYGLRRQFLHASMISMTYHGEKRTWTAPLATDLVKTLELLALD
ncbi:MAG TPA: RluA family pseudouridine synthase [Candidatus Binatia bacterium]|nr:RluA family pseudouridine synthase [Candidatus Binatia bacterium]